ncbi:serine hydrolase domain-containing protein [Actinomadura kijaniata]|uniref:serine hydrolase domain-containing protein n=1 Tax=Actinomadura kijaniata TaxID=46161 RepID=UPI000B11E588|nr:serine hydrolase domain-containing protein [Actinomadura kijaniata]
MTIQRRTFLGGIALAALVSAEPAIARPRIFADVPDKWKAYDDHLEELAAAGRFSGAVLVAKGGRTLLAKGYGMADRARSEPNTARTGFSIGSMNKMMTGVATAQLVAAGRLSFQDTIGAHLSGFPREIADRVTVHHLLTHTSGLGDVPLVDGRRPLTIDELMKEIVKQPPKAEPGGPMVYSNAGYIVLGAIIERVSGGDYARHVRGRILAPARMRHTAFRVYTPSKVPHMAHPYALLDANGRWVGMPRPDGTLPEGELRDVGDRTSSATPGGGAISTVADVLAFSRALLGHRLLDPGLTATVLEGKVDRPGPPGARYGYGFSLDRVNGVDVVGHNGGTMGYWCQLDMYPATGHTVVILTNQDGALPPALRKSRDLVTQP